MSRAHTAVATPQLNNVPPGEGRRGPRAHLRTDAPALDLDGTWRFAWTRTAGDSPWAPAGHVVGLGQARVGTPVPQAHVDRRPPRD